MIKLFFMIAIGLISQNIMADNYYKDYSTSYSTFDSSFSSTYTYTYTETNTSCGRYNTCMQTTFQGV